MSRFSQMLDVELKKRGKSERELAREFGWSQQAFNTWLKGGIPRQQFFVQIGQFLQISQQDLQMLIDEARESTGNTKLPKMDPIYGKVSDRKEGKFAFTATAGMRYPLGRYAIRVDTKIMEPALVLGSKAWLDPAVWPQLGNEVIVHSKSGASWLGRLASITGEEAVLSRYGSDKDVTVTGVEAIHVIVLSERVPSAGVAGA